MKTRLPQFQLRILREEKWRTIWKDVNGLLLLVFKGVPCDIALS
jgi:hypothetical protein